MGEFLYEVIVRARGCSEFFFSQAVEEVQEGWAFIFLVLLPRNAQASVHVVLGASEDLHLVVLANNKLDKVGGAFFESIDTILLAAFLELSSDFGKVSLAPEHKVLLWEAGNLVVLEGVNDIDDRLSCAVIFDQVI